MNATTRLLMLATIAISVAAMHAHAAPKLADVYPDQTDPFTGEYVGRWDASEDVNPDIAALIVPLGKDNYRIRVVSKLDMRCPPLAEVEVAAKDGMLTLEKSGIHGSTDGKTFSGGSGKKTFSMTKVDRQSPAVGAAPPENATVLFDGSNLDAWDGTKDWTVLDNGVLMVTPDADYLVSKGTWRDVKLHIEFRLPYMPTGRGQGRGNSGVFLQDKYEVQILDSFGLEGYYDECGALYKLSAPHVNACYPPLQWQTYDITYHAPRYDDAGKLLANGRMTVYQNGVLIHNDQELAWITEWKEEGRKAAPPKDPGHIKIQGHDNFVQFRNIWLVELKEGE